MSLVRLNLARIAEVSIAEGNSSRLNKKSPHGDFLFYNGRMRHTLIFGIVVILATFAWFKYFNNSSLPNSPEWGRIELGRGVVELELARSLLERERGLSGREPASFPENRAMLFIF